MLTLLRARTFTGAPQAAAYVGLVPIEHQSGTSVLKLPRLSKAGDARLRAALYMAAVVATQYNPDIRRLYRRITGRKYQNVRLRYCDAYARPYLLWRTKISTTLPITIRVNTFDNKDGIYI